MLKLLSLAAALALASAANAQSQNDPSQTSAKCAPLEGKQRADCEAKDTRPQDNGPSTKGVKIDEAHRTAPENKPYSGKNEKDGKSASGGSSPEGRAATRR